MKRKWSLGDQGSEWHQIAILAYAYGFNGMRAFYQGDDLFVWMKERMRAEIQKAEQGRYYHCHAPNGSEVPIGAKQN